MIIISAFGGSVVKEKATGLGANSFVDNPFKLEEIVKAITVVRDINKAILLPRLISGRDCG